MIWNDAKVVAFDVETSGKLPEYALQPWRLPSGDAWLTSLAWIKHDNKQLVSAGSKLFPVRGDLEQLLLDAVINDLWVVTWNGVFDIAWLFALDLGDLAMEVNWLDGMLLWRHLEVEPEYEFQTARHKKKQYKLKPDGIQRFLFGLNPNYGDDVDFHSTDPAELKKLQLYNDRDSVYTWAIAKVIWSQLTSAQQQAALIEARTLPLIAEANFRGLPVDTVACRELGASLSVTADKMLDALKSHGITRTIVRSPKKLASVLFDEWKLPVLKQTKGGDRATDKEVMHELSFTDERVRKVRAYREALNNEAKFSASIIESVNYNTDGKTHPTAIPFGTYSGRLTYASKQGRGKAERQTGFALHQEKRDDLYRSVIVPEPGYTLMEFDAANQEFRWMAIASGDPVMLQLCQPGEDAHAYMASRIVDQDYRTLEKAAKAEELAAKNARQLGKVANLALQYRTSAKKLRSVARVVYEIPMELPEAQRIHSTYQQTYTKVPEYWAKQIQLTQITGYVETFAGRRVQVVGDWNGDWGWSMGSTAINYRIQGTGADQKYLALQVLKSYLRSVGAYFAWDLHDGLYFWVPDAMVERVAVEGKQLLDSLPYQQAWGFTPPVPMPWDCKAGKSWGALRKWSYG